MTPLALGTVALLAAAPPAVALQAPEVVGHAAAWSVKDASLTLDLSSGEQLAITLRDGRVLLAGSEVGSYRPGAALEQAWRELVQRAGDLETGLVLQAAQGLEASGLNGAEQAALQAMRRAFQSLAAGVVVAPEAPRAAGPEAGAAPVTGPAARAVPPQPAAAPRPLMPAIQLDAGPSAIAQIVSGGMSLLATFVALAFMGLGILFFAPRQLDVVSDTVWHSFSRSFLAGLFAQPLMIPVFGAMIVGLVLTVVGILVIPFAVLAFLVGLLLAVAGGYIAIARAVGEIYLRRWKRSTSGGAWIPYKYILYGLGGLLAIWLPAVLLGWVPVAGIVFVVAAALLTWILATAGFGAMLITRAGVRGTMARRLDQALTDERFWPGLDVTAPRSGARSPGADA